jgi:hypothetical protein
MASYRDRSIPSIDFVNFVTEPWSDRHREAIPWKWDDGLAKTPIPKSPLPGDSTTENARTAPQFRWASSHEF